MLPKIEVYTARSCSYCISAKALLLRKGVMFKEIDLGGNERLREEMINRANGRMTVPQIFIGDHHIGGCDDLYALDYAGLLDRLLAGYVAGHGQTT